MTTLLTLGTVSVATPAGAVDDPFSLDVLTGCEVLLRGTDTELRLELTNDGAPVSGVTITADLPAGVTATLPVEPRRVHSFAYFPVTITVAPNAPVGMLTGSFSAVTPDGVIATAPWGGDVVDAPDAPTGVVATPGDGVAHVTWNPSALNLPPSPDGDPPRPRRYTVTASPGGARTTVRTDQNDDPAETVTTVAGLDNGTAYTFTVTAWNYFGETASASSEPVVPAGSPADPGDETGLPGPFAGTFELAPLQGEFGGAGVSIVDDSPGVTAWEVERWPTGDVTLVDRHPAPDGDTGFEVIDTEWDTTVAARVRAVNENGSGPWSAFQSLTVAAPVPGIPALSPALVPGDGRAFVCFHGAWGAGQEITGYGVAIDDGETTRVQTFPPTARSGWVTGLTNERQHTLSVFAMTAGNQDRPPGPYDDTVVVTPSGPPGDVTSVTATPHLHSVTVEWTAPDPAPWEYYVIEASPGGQLVTAGQHDRSALVGVAANGTAYTFTVRAVNGSGEGAAATSAAVVPGGLPGTVTGLSAVPDPATPGNALVSWDAAPDGGNPLLGYTVATEPGDGETAVTGTSVSLPVGYGTFRFAVAARNAVGTGSYVISGYLTLTPDTTPPALTVTAPPAVTLTGKAGIGYGAGDAATYDVRYRVARYDGLFGAYRYPAGWQGSAATAVEVTALPGWTYCFSVRARDVSANVSGWSADSCTAAPLDDRSLTASAGWSRGTSGAYYAGTYTATLTRGATLTRTGVRARRLALVATRCAACGSVGIYLDGTLVKTVGLYAATTKYRQVTSVDLGSVKAGTVTLKALSGRAYVDGLAASRV